jgi:superfamily I DNA and RNA helicase
LEIWEQSVATTIWGSTNKPVSAKRLAELLDDSSGIDGTLYIGYPVLGTPDGAFPFDALLLSPSAGLVAFDIVEGRDIEGFQARQDNIYNKLQSKLLQYPALVKGRQLGADIAVVTYAPVLQNVSDDEDYPVRSDGDIVPFIDAIPVKFPENFPSVAAAIQALTNIRKSRRKRAVLSPNSRGAKLQTLNDSIANLDSNQGRAVVETVEGVQRIRGLAGSGKTIVLALKVAYLHAQNPDWKLAVTFNTRSLKGQFERLINTFVIEQTNEEPDWSNIQILHSWGSPSSDGVYYSFCKMHGLPFRDFRSAQSAHGEGKEFEGICAEALSQVSDVVPSFDAILIDEAQDLPSSFLRLCYALLHNPKRLVYAYDELQSLTDTIMPGPEELFGKGQDGNPLVIFEEPSAGEPRQDIILERCYRNSRPVLATAHALGFGIYREPDGLIQIFEQNDLWLDVGYHVESGQLADGQNVSLARTSDTSPKFLEQHSDIDDLIQFHAFSSHVEHDRWLVEAIKRNIEQDELLPEDVIVINPDPLRTRKMVGHARSALLENGINSSIAGVSTSPDVFFENDVVTFTGIFRAKGNEAAMVYVINANDCYQARHAAYLTKIRNRLFTAITRSKAWVRVLGVGDDMVGLKAEFERVKKHQFRLDFEYPTAEKKKQLRIVNRDLTQAERSKVARKVDDLESVVGSLEAGDVRIEDLPDALKKRLAALLNGAS